MKQVICLAFAVLVFGCAKKDETKTDVAVTKADSIVKPIVGADEDSHGCKTSAGYTWSALSGECVRVFEKATRLDAFDNADNTKMPAFVIFKGNQAEIFIQTEKPFIAERKSEGDEFVSGSWELIPWKGYVLKKDGKILFTGT
ncbi:MAG: hypothetical protein EOO48_08715 [Flavobacterium sp.]|nr:MAG: hypothetical protein EOO48_08715 [Flavobacterium sp.]